MSRSKWRSKELYRVLGLLVALVAGSGIWRLSATWWSGAGLFVDEAQYWDWSRDLAWGYFSKPPVLPALIRLSTWIAGDSVAGVRWLVVFIWTLTPLVIWGLVRDMLRDSTVGGAKNGLMAGAWAAAICSAMLPFALLGQVSTTDGPLLFFWSLLMWTFWRAQQSPDRQTLWALLGMCLALAILSKYTATVAGASLLVIAWRQRQRKVWLGLGLTFSVCIVALIPHLAWNQRQGWPTLRHTTEILGQGHAQAHEAVWTSALSYVLSQGLLIGPVVIGLALYWLFFLRRSSMAEPMAKLDTLNRQSLISWSWSWVWPLWLIGLIQALWGKAQMNWPAPALLALAMMMALWRAKRSTLTWFGPWWVWVAGSLLGAIISLGGEWRQHLLPGNPGPRWDLWARAKGWDNALLSMRVYLARYPDMPVISSERALIAHAAYAWRDHHRRVVAWSPTGAPAHHYEMANTFNPENPLNTGRSVLMISTTEQPRSAPWLEFFPHRHLLHRHVEMGRTLYLWKLDPR